MEVIGETKDKYICIIDHTELEKFLGQYYNNLKRLKPGDIVDLGKGYDFHRDIKDAFEKTSNLITSNKKVIEAIFNGITVVTNNHELEAE